MRFHALLPVRDEADIIGQSLRHLLEWADTVYVFDSGSEDETWEIVNHFAAKDSRVRPLRKERVVFSDKTVRAWIFHQARRGMREGDWFLRVDADEFHHESPREFVQARMKKHETVAYHQYYDFRLTESEAKAWDEGREQADDRQRLIEERRRWFTVTQYTEPRLCRYRSSMQWPASASFPHNAGFLARERLPIRHYPHRDPMQMQQRCRLRALMAPQLDNPSGHPWAIANWRRHVVAAGTPGLQYWKPGTDLPRFHFTNHLAPMPKRLLQRVIHAGFLPILDTLRDGHPEDGNPGKIQSDCNGHTTSCS